MEELLHYVWKHRILPLRELKTTDGREIEVISPGMHNHDAGPDFSGAIVKIGGIEWVGNVEIHVRTSDWLRHGHDKDANYDNIILHVVAIVDCELNYPDGNAVPQFQIEVPEYVRENYDSLLRSDYTPRCTPVISCIPRLTIHNWMSALQVERLQMRTEQIMERRESLGKNWEDTLFATIARNLGFGKNGDAFEQWAHSIPMNAVGKHRDSLFQIEAIFFGQAGLLGEGEQPPLTPPYNEYYVRLAKEYRYLRQKFSLTPINPKVWKFLRLRPQNFPHVRIAQLAMMYYRRQISVSKLINADSIEEIQCLFRTEVSDFWRTHYNFNSAESAVGNKQLSKSSVNLLIINSVAPFLFAYGTYKGDELLRDKAISLWESVKPEDNRIIRDWKSAGIEPEHAGDTQALIQLTSNYCNRHDCLRCRFGSEYIRRTPTFLCEKEE